MSVPKNKLLPPVADKHNVVLLSCGSFSPITLMHLRLFPLCRDFLNNNGHFVRGCYISPVHDSYGKKDLVAAEHRLEMCRRATNSNSYLMVSDWEASQESWSATRKVLDHFYKEVNEGESPSIPTDVFLICGSDLLDSFNTPGLWSEDDMKKICSYGICVVQREGISVADISKKNLVLSEFLEKGKIIAVALKIENNVSSTAVRAAIRNGEDIQYLTPDSVVEYIKEKNLWH